MESPLGFFWGVFVGYGYFNSPACGSLPGAGDVRGADPVAVSDRGQPLHGRAEQAPECLGLGLAQLRVLGGNMRHRTVMLAELLAAASRGCPASRGGVAVGGQRRGERLNPAGRLAPATAGGYRRSRSAICWRANSVTAPGPAISARNRSALAARSS